MPAARPVTHQMATPAAGVPYQHQRPAGMGRFAAMAALPLAPVAYAANAVNSGGPAPAYLAGAQSGGSPPRYDHPNLPGYAWPSYASYPNYAAVTYPRQHSAAAWPYIGPFYPYPQVPLGWRKVTLQWDDGWWFLDFWDK